LKLRSRAYDRFTALFDAAISPREQISFADWLPKNIKLIDGPNAGDLWNAAGAPYLLGNRALPG
jgi:hypothetical protein